MVSPLRVETPSNFPRMIALTVGDPNTGGCTRLRTTKNQLRSIRRHASTKVPAVLAAVSYTHLTLPTICSV